MTLLPALTIFQPWASLVAIGAKPDEFRGRPAPACYVGERIAVHAAARPVQRAEVDALLFALRGGATGLDVNLAQELLEAVRANPFALPLSAILCTAVLGAPRQLADSRAAVVGDSLRTAHQRWAWPLSDVVRLWPPVTARGAQGFWRIRLDHPELALA